MRPSVPAALALLLASACAPGTDPAATGREAGAPSGPAFGAATANNHLVNVSEQAPLAAIGARFASEVPTQVTFDFDNAALTAPAARILDAQADWMRQFPELGFRVYGHADSPGDTSYNERLGRARAEVVVAYLESRGVSRARLEALVSFGEERPAVPGAGRERRNRRVATAVSGFDRRHPTILNGKYAEVVFREYVESARPAPAGNQAPVAEIGAPAAQ